MDLDDEFEVLLRRIYEVPVAEYSEQWREMRRAFYAGAACVFMNSLEITELAPEVAEAALGDVRRQLEEFFLERVAHDRD